MRRLELQPAPTESALGAIAFKSLYSKEIYDAPTEDGWVLQISRYKPLLGRSPSSRCTQRRFTPPPRGPAGCCRPPGTSRSWGDRLQVAVFKGDLRRAHGG